MIGSMSAIKARAPVLGGNFGIWGGLFSSFDCAVKGYRQKEDPWNAIISGFMTGGTLAIRGEVCSWSCRIYDVRRQPFLGVATQILTPRLRWPALRLMDTQLDQGPLSARPSGAESC